MAAPSIHYSITPLLHHYRANRADLHADAAVNAEERIDAGFLGFRIKEGSRAADPNTGLAADALILFHVGLRSSGAFPPDNLNHAFACQDNHGKALEVYRFINRFRRLIQVIGINGLNRFDPH